MRWDRLFDDLELQLASEWEAERAALDSEAERLRISRLTLQQRLAQVVGQDAPEPVLSFDLADGATVRGSVTGVGADCLALLPADGPPGAVVVPLPAIVAIGMPHDEVTRSVRSGPVRSGLSDRLTLGFVLRDLVRRRVGVAVHLVTGRALHGTLDRAGSDHLDLALHDPGAPRRADAVTGHRVVPFATIAWVRVDGPTSVLSRGAQSE